MLQIPIQPVPSQQLQVVLAGQNCQIAIYLRGTNLYVDLNVNGLDIAIATLAQDVNALNPISYSTFQGQLMFTDTQGTSDPTYDGLGSRYQLVYLTAAEYASL